MNDPKNSQGSANHTIEVVPFSVSRPFVTDRSAENVGSSSLIATVEPINTPTPNPLTATEEKIETLTREIHGMKSLTSQLTGVEALGQTPEDNPETGLDKSDILAAALAFKRN